LSIETVPDDLLPKPKPLFSEPYEDPRKVWIDSRIHTDLENTHFTLHSFDSTNHIALCIRPGLCNDSSKSMLTWWKLIFVSNLAKLDSSCLRRYLTVSLKRSKHWKRLLNWNSWLKRKRAPMTSFTI
jgi:hypothetical protein